MGEPLFNLRAHLSDVQTIVHGGRECSSNWSSAEHILARAQHSDSVFVTGIGGSSSAASLFAALLRDRIGVAALSVPVHNMAVLRAHSGVGVVLVSASASHPSLWQAATAMAKSGAWLSICSLVTSSPLELIDNPSHRARYKGVGYDEFLATRSLSSLLSRIFWCFDGEAGAIAFSLALSASTAVGHRLPSYKKIVVVYDNWGESPALDLLMRCRETSILSSVAICWSDYVHGGYISSSVPNTGTIFFLGAPACDVIKAASPSFPHVNLRCGRDAESIGTAFGFSIGAHARALYEERLMNAPENSSLGKFLWEAAR